MTELNLEQLNKAKQAASLDSVRKSEIKRNLLAAMENNPVRIGLFRRLTHCKALQFLNNRSLATGLLAVLFTAIFLSAGAGTALAANQSLPGDWLYPIKINVMEKIKVALATSSEAKADAKLELLDNRFEEGTTLASRGTLDADTAAELEVLIDQYKIDLENIFAGLPEDQKLGLVTSINARLEAMINIHERALAKFADDEDNNNFRINLHDRLDGLAKARQEVTYEDNDEGQESDKFNPAAANKIGAAENVLAEATKYVEKFAAKGVSANVESSANGQIQLAQDKLDAAREENKDGKYREAFLSANETIRLAQQAKAVVRIGHNLNVDLDVSTGSVKGSRDDQDSEQSEEQGDDNDSNSHGFTKPQNQESEDEQNSEHSFRLRLGL